MNPPFFVQNDVNGDAQLDQGTMPDFAFPEFVFGEFAIGDVIENRHDLSRQQFEYIIFDP